MGRIQTNVGLATGIQIGDTVDALMAIAARPRDNLAARTAAIQDEQIAISELAGLLFALKSTAAKLAKTTLFHSRTATSSNPSALSVTVDGEPPLGTYRFTPLRTAQSQQLLSSGFRSADDPIGAGTLSFRFGEHVERATPLELLRGGQGFDRGTIRITDRSGAQAEIDLATAISVEDVLEAINGNTGINLTAVARGDGFWLLDNTGQTASNLKVEEVGAGTTAASLGLAGIDVAADVADGQDVLRLYEDLDLDQLNDGSGVRIDTILDDVAFTLRDGTTGTIDFSPIIPGGSQVDYDLTLGDVIERINAAAPGQIQAAIAADGDRLVLTDLTSGGGEFTLTATGSYDVLSDLGLDSAAAGGTITGRRVLAGTQTVLLSSLGGGEGLGQLGSLQLTDRSGATATVDLSTAETLQDVVELIDAAGVGIEAGINSARTGVRLVDTTGSTAGNLIVASGDATNTAELLGIAVDDAVDEVAGGDLHLQVVGLNTRLADYNGGSGVARGTFVIRDSAGVPTTVNLQSSQIETIGDVVREINRLADNVRAEINPTGDGIRLVDTADGAGELEVEEGSSTAAADLHLLGAVAQVEIEGETHQVVDGSTTHTIELDDTTTLYELRDAINELDAGVTASIIADGSSRPYHLALYSDRAGRVGRLVIDTSQAGFSMTEIAQGQDALLAMGDLTRPETALLISSPTNRFTEVMPGATLEILQPTGSPVSVTVGTSDDDLVSAVRALVEGYNRFRDRLLTLTEYNEQSETLSILTGDGTALRLDSDLSRFLSGALDGAGPIRSLAEVGIHVEDDATLSFDQSVLGDRFAADPDAVEQFFTTEDVGFAAKLEQLVEQLAGEDDSLLEGRIDVLAEKIERNQQRISEMDEQLASQRERLLLQFYRMEVAVGKMQTVLTALDSIQALEPLRISERWTNYR